ncbi:bacillithiol biosynthesis deacetylase BshB1 [bacterium]|nr:bacillithiol biosynthesis deacetylase BshB1 [bacterium]
MKLDVLAFAAHPDDVELACSGTLIKLKKSGKRIGIVDLTEGEMGTRGTPEIRKAESKASSEIMGLDVRENLNLGDAWFEISKSNQLKVIESIRAYQPDIILVNAKNDRHTDHPKGGELVKQAAFLSGLAKVETEREGVKQDAWRPKHIFHYIQYLMDTPDFIVDISDEFETKMKAIQAYKSQFYNPESDEPKTLISSQEFLKYIEARARECGSAIESTYGEGFHVIRPLSLDMADLLPK